MFVYSSIPFLILNLSFSIIVTNRMIKGRSYSSYKPRFDFYFVMIWSYVPISIMSAITDSFLLDYVNNHSYCTIFTNVLNLSWISFFAGPVLCFYLFLLIFTRINLKTVNKVGNISLVALVILVLIRGYLVTYFVGVKRYNPLENGRFTECLYANEKLVNFTLILSYLSQGVVLGFVFLIFFYDKFQLLKVKKKKFKMKKKDESDKQKNNYNLKVEEKDVYKCYRKLSRINMMRSFIWMGVATVLISVGERIIKWSGLFPRWFHYIAVDFKRLKPFIYSLIIILCDKPASINIQDYPLKKILEIPELTKMLEEFLIKKGDKMLKENFEKIKKCYLKEVKRENKRKLFSGSKIRENDIYETDFHEKKGNDICEKDLVLLEKEMFANGLCEFYLTDDFIFFLYKFQYTGVIEMEIGDQRRE